MDRSLPIHTAAPAILEALTHHRVVVVEGAAGTGKTTQLPQILRRAGRVPRLMGVTQPRRIAAVGVAARMAAQLGPSLCAEVGYAIRFDDTCGPQTRIKVMTDGILLQEARHDDNFAAYDIIMVDEAHERSLNIDFVMGLLRRALQRRAALRVIISSATLHPGTFQAFFAPAVGTVPVVSLQTRTYPLHVRHAPLHSGAPEVLCQAVVQHIQALEQSQTAGHVLVFLPGEAAIVRAAAALLALRRGAAWRILPLYGRLTRSEQEQVFMPSPNARKIVLSTNLAETSLTIDGVCTVIDSGLHKLPWFSASTGITTLREEPISQASATQRAGRAGRVAPGTVVRLYSEETLKRARPFTPEEIVRVDLSEALLRLIDLGVRDVQSFALPTPPPPRKVRAALQTLRALGAIDAGGQLTPLGRQMVPFPLSPQLSRMVVEALRSAPTTVGDVLLVGAFLSVRSPFTFPAGQEDEARRAQRRMADPHGDAITALRAYAGYSQAKDADAYCRQNFLDADTMHFIGRAHRQLCDIAKEHGAVIGPPSRDHAAIVRCVACGFADRILRRRGMAYETWGGVRVALHPSSSLFAQPPRFAVAAELMEAGRVYAFNASALRPEWLWDINPQAAKIWLPKGGAQPHNARATPPAAPPPPPVLVVGGVQLQVAARRRRPLVTIDLAQIPALLAAPERTLTPAQRPWRAQVISGSTTLMRQALGYVLAALPVVPWPAATGKSAPLPPLGALLEADRNLHLVSRFIAQLGSPLPLVARRGRRAPPFGWLALVGNGGDGYWFDAIPDYPEALAVSLAAIEHLQQGPGATQVDALQPTAQRLASCAQAFAAAVIAARQG